MSDTTEIEWADSTFNPWEGCTKVGPGCDNCYAENRNARFAGGAAINWGPGAPRRRTSIANWRKPIAWNLGANAFEKEHGRRRRVFCASLADVFDNAVDSQWRADLFELIAMTPRLDWLLLTKRIGNSATMIERAVIDIGGTANIDGSCWPWPNVWLGATIVNQAEADRDIPKLLAVLAEKRFLSVEPLLGPVDLTEQLWYPPEDYETPPERRMGIDWIIVGGESGPRARPMYPKWPRDIRDQCAAAGAAFFMKQMGGARDKRGALEDLPEDIRVREFPK